LELQPHEGPSETQLRQRIISIDHLGDLEVSQFLYPGATNELKEIEQRD